MREREIKNSRRRRLLATQTHGRKKKEREKIGVEGDEIINC